MTSMTAIEDIDGSITYLDVVGKKVRVTKNGSFHFLTASAVKKSIRTMEAKTNLRPSSVETLIFYKKVLRFCEAHGLIHAPPAIIATGNDFDAWQKRMGFNNIQAADALGMGRNQPQKYKDGQPIPRYVALACAAIEKNIDPIGAAH